MDIDNIDIDVLREKRRKLSEESKSIITGLDNLAKESARVASIAENSREYLEAFDKEFEEKTALNDTDFMFVLFAAMLQTVRWILMPELKLPQMENLDLSAPKEERLRANERNHKEGIYAGKSSGAEYELNELKEYREKHSDIAKESADRFYKKQDQYRSWIEILTQPVPYDAIIATDKSLIPNIANLNKQDSKGNFNNLYGGNHHVATLGHDPVLGWIFGTANIMTSTVTFSDFQSYEVLRGRSVRSTGQFDVVRELQYSDQKYDPALPRTLISIFSECYLSTREDYKRIAAAVVKQAIHLASDKYCIQGLPIPLLSVIDPENAQELIEKGWNSIEFENLLKNDLKQIGISAIISIMINLVIKAIYLFCLDSEESFDLRRVKIKKILNASGIIAESSNVFYVTISKNISKLDIGGLGAMMINLLKTPDFVMKVKQEYIRSNMENLIMNSPYEV